MQLSAEVGRRLRELERWLLPAECLLCGQPVAEVEGDSLVCRMCQLRWPALPEPRCSRCGQPLSDQLPCRLCPDWPSALGRVRSAAWLDGSARQAVHLLKYEGWWRLAEPMAQVMASRLAPLPADAVLIPVPLGPRRQRQRGYNQSECLARALADCLGLRWLDALGRARETPTQTSLPPESRYANVAGAFRSQTAVAGRPVLVDDVFTTGATLSAAATALAERGAERVEAITFARARPVLG